MTDDQVAGMLRAIEHTAENEQAISASDARFLLAHIATQASKLVAARTEAEALIDGIAPLLVEVRNMAQGMADSSIEIEMQISEGWFKSIESIEAALAIWRAKHPPAEATARKP